LFAKFIDFFDNLAIWRRLAANGRDRTGTVAIMRPCQSKGRQAMANIHSNPDNVRPPGVNYHHSVEVPTGSRMLYVAGQTGLADDDTVPADIESQSEIAFANIEKILAASGFGLEDIVFMKSFLTRREDRDGYQKVRSAVFGDIRPASTFLLVSGLARPEFLVEVEVIAAKSD
jgi:enamine deaminase RidA (YjgF/YER057c/UK114 family)